MWINSATCRRILLAVACLPAPGWACGPWFDTAILSAGDRALLSPHEAMLRSELGRITPAHKDKYEYIDGQSQELDRLARADVVAALAGAEIPEPQRAKALTEWEQAQKLVREQVDKVRAWQRKVDNGLADAKDRPKLQAAIHLPETIPPQFRWYLAGVIHWCEGEPAKARTAWRKVLGLGKEAYYRATWAAYMIARTWQAQDKPADAIAAYQRVRALVDKGFADAQGLAVASLGWEGRAELDRGKYAEALELYFRQWKLKDPTALASLQKVCAELLRAKPAVLREVARRPIPAQVYTSYLLARGGQFGRRPDADHVAAWALAVEATGAGGLVSADKLAWSAYMTGQFKLARKWIVKAPPASTMARWISAKLLLRDGKQAEAAKELALSVRLATEDPQTVLPRMWYEEGQVGESEFPTSAGRQAAGELAVLKMSTRDYVEALDLLLRFDWWTDAAYVAERVLTAEELTDYVDRKWDKTPDGQAVVLYDKGGEQAGQSAWLGTRKRIRHLLARRLVRLGDTDKARKYFHGENIESLDRYVLALEAGRNPQRAAKARADSLWEAARIARHCGMDLMGTEHGPDGAIYGGMFSVGQPFRMKVEAGESISLAPPSRDEKIRVAGSVAVPTKRFHYRYIAAELVLESARLLPDNSPVAAHRLCVGGRWISAKDPKAADILYQALVARHAKTELGRQAVRKRWLPRVKEEGFDGADFSK